MGATLIHESRHGVSLHNWRAAKELKDYRYWRPAKEVNHHRYKEKKTPGLLIALESFRCYFIPDFTIDMLYYENDFNNTLYIPYVYVKNFLSCCKCCGTGKIDWVDNVMNKKSYESVYYNFKTQFTVSEYMKSDASSEHPYYIGVPHLNKGEEICNECRGIGIHKKSLDLS